METMLFTLRQCRDYFDHLKNNHKRQLLQVLQKFADEADLGDMESLRYRETLNEMLANRYVKEEDANALVIKLKELIQ